jgi:hypothetical protein
MNFEKYEVIREEVWKKATFPSSGTLEEHKKNQALFKSKLISLSQPIDHMSPAFFFREYWEHHRWAGIKAQTGTQDVAIHKELGFFHNYESLCSSLWDYPNQVKWDCVKDWGTHAQAYLNKEKSSDNGNYVANPHKLKKTIAVARAIAKAVYAYGEKEFLRGILSKDFYEQKDKVLNTGNSDFALTCIKSWVKQLNKIAGGNSSITHLHLFMDLQFPTIKPDIVVTDIFYRLGWISDVINELDLTRKDIGKIYRDPKVYWRVIQVGIELARQYPPIISDNAIREVDFFIVKYGQEPEPSAGVVRNLDKELPVEHL